jgi:hypothetical protein
MTSDLRSVHWLCCGGACRFSAINLCRSVFKIDEIVANGVNMGDGSGALFPSRRKNPEIKARNNQTHALRTFKRGCLRKSFISFAVFNFLRASLMGGIPMWPPDKNEGTIRPLVLCIKRLILAL